MSEGATLNQLSPLPAAASVNPGPAEAKRVRDGGAKPRVSMITALGLATIWPETGPVLLFGASPNWGEAVMLGAAASRAVSDPSPTLKTSHAVFTIDV